MGVVLRNLQKVVPLRRARLRRDVDTLRHILGVQKFDLGIICVDNNRIQQINNIYRKKNVPTDVLSFPFYEDLRPGKLPCPVHRDELNLGDIFLGVEFVMKQCQDESVDLYGSLAVITAHGICHLLGYRHETEEEWTELPSLKYNCSEQIVFDMLLVAFDSPETTLKNSLEKEGLQSNCSLFLIGRTRKMLQKESYILSEYNRLTGSHLEPLTKRCSQDR